MKRTCKNCAARDNYWWCLLPTNTDKDCHSPDDTPACENWEFDLDSIDVMDAVLKARRKHPVFLDVWPEPEDADYHLAAAKMWKRKIGWKTRHQLRSILFSEVEEFLAEVARGDLDRALEEAGDVMAVIYRAINGDGQPRCGK